MRFSSAEVEALRLIVWDWMVYAQAHAESEGAEIPLLHAVERLNEFLDVRVQGEDRREFLSKILGNYFGQVDQH
jgi:hypothetical protein